MRLIGKHDSFVIKETGPILRDGGNVINTGDRNLCFVGHRTNLWNKVHRLDPLKYLGSKKICSIYKYFMV